MEMGIGIFQWREMIGDLRLKGTHRIYRVGEDNNNFGDDNHNNNNKKVVNQVHTYIKNQNFTFTLQ